LCTPVDWPLVKSGVLALFANCSLRCYDAGLRVGGPVTHVRYCTCSMYTKFSTSRVHTKFSTAEMEKLDIEFGPKNRASHIDI
jgi:hypothetical protein